MIEANQIVYTQRWANVRKIAMEMARGPMPKWEITTSLNKLQLLQ